MDNSNQAQQFSQGAMVAYAYKAYCAGWKAAIAAAMGDPSELSENHWGDWLEAFPPSEKDMPLFREADRKVQP